MPAASGFRRFLQPLLSWIPGPVRREFRTRGGEARFLMWVSFLAGFLWMRFSILYLSDRYPTIAYHDDFQWGSRVILFGYHPHHIAFGVFLLAVAGWLGIHYGGRIVTRVAAVSYGLGLGFIIDEVAFIVEGIGHYPNEGPEVFVLFVVVAGLLMSTVYFPSFWRVVGERLVGLVWRRAHGGRPAPSAVVPPEALAPPSPAPTDAAEPEPPKP